MHYQPIWTSMFIFKPHNYIGWFPFHRNNQKIQQKNERRQKTSQSQTWAKRLRGRNWNIRTKMVRHWTNTKRDREEENSAESALKV